MEKQFLIAFLLIAVAFGTQYVPIPDYYDGVHIGKAGAKLHLEAFYDLLCPDSKASNAILNQVFAKVDTSNVLFTYHIFPLPYHIQAYLTAMGARYFVDTFGNDAAVLYFNHVFDV